jgi:hypothetical protein
MRLWRPGSSQLSCHNQTDPLPNYPSPSRSIIWPRRVCLFRRQAAGFRERIAGVVEHVGLEDKVRSLDRRGRSFPLRLQPICSCFRLIFLKMTCSRFACERTAVSVRFIRIPIARTLSPVRANHRSLSSSARVHGREAKFSGSDIGRPLSRAPSFKALSMSRCIDHSPAALPPQGT